mmetsp:Transcript_35642/g.55632  ORF Transcript_35642/g.55632 Transcript_35642/m.55632 type:complete len:84 (+) Transcript_35642:928-1179(+)
MDNREQSLKQAAQWLKEADFILLSTGAGWSADSGLPTYNSIANTISSSPSSSSSSLSLFLSLTLPSLSLLNEGLTHSFPRIRF